MYDLAREQSPTLDHLRRFCKASLDSGYNALGLYIEHRFAYPSTPWSHGKGCVTPEMIQQLQTEFPNLQLIPFVNLLGHFEGMIYTEEGKKYREVRFQGMQACPSNSDFVELCKGLLADIMSCFDSEIIHIGGDETWQLGQCEICKSKVEAESGDGKAKLYGAHFGPLTQWVSAQGRRPAVWGDMFLEHSEALSPLSKETLIFDWQYFSGIKESAQKFIDKGFEVVGCPTLQTYNATWMHLTESEENVRAVVKDVVNLSCHGVCVTTWENALFGSYDTILPAIEASGEILNGASGRFLESYDRVSERHGLWAEMMGIRLQEAGGCFAHSKTRSSLKVRLLLNANPFLAWLHHGEKLSGEVGDAAWQILEESLQIAPDEATKGISFFGRSAVEFVQIAERARIHYAKGETEKAIGVLSVTRKLFDDLEMVAKRTHQRIGGSLADIERCRIAKRHIETVLQRIRQFGDGSLGYLPAFEHITHQKFVPHDQGAWWLINKWANE